MKQVLVFPGQGSQFVGMGKDLYESFSDAREVFEEIDESLSQNLTKIMFEDPDNRLNLTENTQPALMAVSMAVMNILEKQGRLEMHNICTFAAGHSLGEYSALTAAGSLKLSDTAQLLKLRGQSMQKAVPIGVGSMAAILGLDLDAVNSIVKEASNTEICQTANDNCAGQVVISGHKGAVESAIAIATERGAKRAITLPVSAPFHCALMEPAAVAMEEALADTIINAPSVPIVSNITAQGVTDPDEIRRLLVNQVTGMVRWRESVLWMKEQGVDSMVEVGAGKVLSGLTRRIDREISCQNVGTPEQVEAFIEHFNT